jgi:hypothetical protein
MKTPGLLEFCAEIESTPLSNWIKDHSEWFIPTIQVIHIVCIAAILVSSLMINAKVLSSNSGNHKLQFELKRFSPVIFGTLILLFLSGSLMIIGEPARSLANSAFQCKMLFLILAILILLIIKNVSQKNSMFQPQSLISQLTLKSLAIISTILWISIIFAGRWIAYL